jgi:hypothetical protein
MKLQQQKLAPQISRKKWLYAYNSTKENWYDRTMVYVQLDHKPRQNNLQTKN